jgi:hypothetical protein
MNPENKKSLQDLGIKIVQISDDNNINDVIFDNKGKPVKLVRILFEKKWTSDGYRASIYTINPNLTDVLERISNMIGEVDNELSVVKKGFAQKNGSALYKISYTH